MMSLTEDTKRLDFDLYNAKYVMRNNAQREEIWNSIKGNYKILELAIQVIKDKWNEKDTFFAPAIVECMLLDYERANVENPNQLSLIEDYYAYANLYQLLVNRIYSNCDLARIVLDGYSNGGFSFLLYTLFNNNLELTEEQKAFAIEEAMNKAGTTKYSRKMDDYERILEKNGINDSITVMAPEVGPIGAKTGMICLANTFTSMSINQAHGSGELDIRYHILKNHNFFDEMEQLVYNFYVDDNVFDEVADYWEREIANLSCAGKDNEPRIYLDEILFIEEDEVFRRLPFEQATEVINEINFIKRIYEIRPRLEQEALQKKLV